MITGERKQEYLDFFNRILKSNRLLSEVKMISDLDDSGNPVAVVLFSRFNGANMELAIASTQGWQASRRFLRECFYYAFETCGSLRVTSVIDIRNTQAIKFNTRLGLKPEFEGNLKNFFGEGADGKILVMHKNECKWIGKS